MDNNKIIYSIILEKKDGASICASYEDIDTAKEEIDFFINEELDKNINYLIKINKEKETYDITMNGETIESFYIVFSVLRPSYKKLLVGSTYFFSKIDGFSSKDKDFVIFEDCPLFYNRNYRISGNGECVFRWKVQTPEKFVEMCNSSQDHMIAGKFLVPEVCNRIGFTINHLKQIKNSFYNIDKRHTYEKIIFDSYMENGSFTLTDEQRMKAYEEYKRTRENN